MMFDLFFFNDTATTEIYTLSLHDALPIFLKLSGSGSKLLVNLVHTLFHCFGLSLKLINFFGVLKFQDRKSTRLNSSHANISYAVFCLKKKKSIIKRLIVIK